MQKLTQKPHSSGFLYSAPGGASGSHTEPGSLGPSEGEVSVLSQFPPPLQHIFHIHLSSFDCLSRFLLRSAL